MLRTLHVLACLGGWLWATAPLVARADEAAAPRHVTIHPMAEPKPALEYSLLPRFPERLPGNAAVDYGQVHPERSDFFANRALQDKFVAWQETPLADLRRDKVLDELKRYDWMYTLLVRAARRETCDWQQLVPGQDYFSVRLPEIQGSRVFTRYLGARARAEIAEGQFDQALQTFQAGFAQGQHLAQSPFLVSDLVALAVSGMMTYQLQEFVQQPQAPNLYWALTTLPRPLIDMRIGIAGESSGLELSIPELREIATADWPAERWQQLLVRLNQLAPEPLSAEALAAQLAKKLPLAKAYLGTHGYAPEAVDAMPAPQVAVLYTMKTFQEFRDEEVRCFFLPYPEAIHYLGYDARQRFREEDRAIVAGPYDTLPGYAPARKAMTRIDREVALLRTIEALRIFAAVRDGQLPQTLSELTVPVPLDPVTEQPFVYERRGEQALLKGPALYEAPLVVEIELAR